MTTLQEEPSWKKTNSEVILELPILILILPETLNLIFLISGVTGMYNGVEIQHPLYTVLFTNLVVPLITSVLNLSSLTFISGGMYIRFSNLLNGLSMSFHCTAWFTTSLIRYIYIVHRHALHDRIPNMKHQCLIAVLLQFVLTFVLLLPLAAVLIRAGTKITIFCSFFKKWANPGLFFVYFWSFSNKHYYNFYNRLM